MTPELREVEKFSEYYESEKRKGAYKAGGNFDEKRRAYFKTALQWHDTTARKAAADMMQRIINDWSRWPSNKERKTEFQAWLQALSSTTPTNSPTKT